MTKLIQTPPRIVENHKVVDFGLFEQPFRELNLTDADIFGTKAKEPEIFRKLRLKQWQHFAVITKDVFLGFMVLDSTYLGASFCYFVEKETGRYAEHHREGPGWIARVSKELWNDDCVFKGRNYFIEINNRLEQGVHLAKVDVKETKKIPRIKANLEMLENLAEVQPIVAVLPIKQNRPLYTHKIACPVRGEIHYGDKKAVLNEKTDLVLIDVQKTYYSYNTFWRWATFAGYDDQGRIIAMNLVQNMIEDDVRYNENCLWVGGKLSQWGGARFEFDEKNTLAPWRIHTTDGSCDLLFTPEGEREGKVNFGFIKSDYHQPYGRFSGTVKDNDGVMHEVKNLFGVTEHHLARF